MSAILLCNILLRYISYYISSDKFGLIIDELLQSGFFDQTTTSNAKPIEKPADVTDTPINQR